MMRITGITSSTQGLLGNRLLPFQVFLLVDRLETQGEHGVQKLRGTSLGKVAVHLRNAGNLFNKDF